MNKVRAQKSSVLVLVLIFTIINLFAQSREEVLKNKLEPFIQKTMQELDIPGFALGIVKDGKIIYLKGFGVQSLKTSQKVTSRTQFLMASISKTFTATAVMQLVEKGVLKLEEKVVKFLPYFKLTDKTYKEISLRQLLSHTSGMPDVYKRNYGWETPEFDNGARERYIRTKLVDQKMEFNPGEKFSYNNMGYVILAEVVAEVSGTTYEDYVKKNILLPLGMKNSTFLPQEVNKSHLAWPHELGADFKSSPGIFYPTNRWSAGAGGLMASCEDMCKWVSANLKGGILNGQRVLKKTSLDLMWKKGEGKSGNVGLCWKMGNYLKKKLIYHSGGTMGFAAEIDLIPEESLAVVVMCNSYNDVWSIAANAMKIMLGVEPRAFSLPLENQLINQLHKGGVDAAVRLYRKLRKETPAKEFSSRTLLMLGSRIMNYCTHRNRLDIAGRLLQLAVEYFPKDAYTYDFLAEAYLRKAMINYNKSVKLDPANWGAAKILKALSAVDK